MPTVHEEGRLRFFFYTVDWLRELPHVHAAGSGRSARLWLRPVRVAWTRGLTEAEVRRVMRITAANQAEFLHAWRRLRSGEG